MREIRTSGLMSGDGNRSVATQGPSYRARPRLYERLSGSKVRGDLLLNNLHQISHFVQPVDMLINLPWISSYVSGHRPLMTLKKDLICILSC